jgi:hypothetical protein
VTVGVSLRGLPGSEAPEEALAVEGDPERLAVILEDLSQLSREPRRCSLVLAVRDYGSGQRLPVTSLTKPEAVAPGTTESDANDSFLNALSLPPSAFT